MANKGSAQLAVAQAELSVALRSSKRSANSRTAADAPGPAKRNGGPPAALFGRARGSRPGGAACASTGSPAISAPRRGDGDVGADDAGSTATTTASAILADAATVTASGASVMPPRRRLRRPPPEGAPAWGGPAAGADGTPAASSPARGLPPWGGRAACDAAGPPPGGSRLGRRRRDAPRRGSA